MIKFFRKIRRKLIDNGNLKRYLIYAIGEILLVMIGILLALYINNKNEDRKTKNKTEIYLAALKSDLTNDTILISKEIALISKHYNSNESFRQRVASPKATLDTLVKVARFEFDPGWNDQLSYNNNSYQNLIQSGLIEELPDHLKSDIKNFYNERYSLISDAEKANADYRKVLMDYSNNFVFTAHAYADQGKLIDSLLWNDINHRKLAGQFNKISQYKRILFGTTLAELNYSLTNSRILITQISELLEESS